MKRFNLSTLFLFVSLTSFVISCKEDDEPKGAEGALGKQFNLAIDKVTSSMAYSVMVSSDGTKVFVTTTPTGGYYLSSDGGTTFSVADNYYLRLATSIDNLGNILTSDRYLINGSTLTSVNSYDQLILGDNGKIFSYNGVIKYKEISGSSDFTTIENPSTPAGGVGVYVVKAPGKGLLYLEATSTTAKAWFLDEGTLEWSEPVTVTFDSAPLNTGCNNLNMFTKFSYAGNNQLIVKGCTGFSMIDLTTSNETTAAFPVSDNEHLIYEDIRDGQLFVDSEKRVYIVASTYEDASRTKIIYRYNGNSWSRLEGQFPVNQSPVFSTDQAGNIFYNAGDGAGGSLRGAVKVNAASGEKMALSLPTENLLITDAAAISDNILLITVENVLYEHDIAANKTTRTPVLDVSHINLLTDGRLIAGGIDKLYVSSDDGKNWTETKNIFSSIDPNFGNAAVSESRVVDGKILLVGTYHYYYDNLSLGIRQDKYNNIAVTFDGTSTTQAPYVFPGDFKPTTIGTDGTIYGAAILQFEWQTVAEPYELKPNIAPQALTGFTTTPQAITDSGLQLSILGAQGGGLEVKKRGTSTDDWESTNTPLPNGNFYGDVSLRVSGDRLLVINNSQVYISGN